MTNEITDIEFEPVEQPITELYRYNGVIHLYIRMRSELLDTLVPEGVPDSAKQISEATYDQEGNELTPAVYAQKTVMEFIHGEGRVNYSPDGTECTFLACKMDGEVYRLKKFVEKDWFEWIQYADFVWPEQYTALTYEENAALVAEWDRIDETITP